MGHVTHMNESRHAYERVMYAWVMSHIWMGHVTHAGRTAGTCNRGSEMSYRYLLRRSWSQVCCRVFQCCSMSHQLLITGVLQCVSVLQYVISAPDHRCVVVCFSIAICHISSWSQVCCRVFQCCSMSHQLLITGVLQCVSVLQCVISAPDHRSSSHLLNAMSCWWLINTLAKIIRTHCNTPVIRSWCDILQ